jgi:serine/threonine protein kinase
MELFHGIPLTRYCDENKLTPRARLELFISVCQAIQHPHQKGIIHRDIKPSNVLVTLYDGKPVPKVIDFGIAKATEQRLTERTMFTQHGTVLGTLEYMSPEQAELSALGRGHAERYLFVGRHALRAFERNDALGAQPGSGAGLQGASADH